MLEFVKKEEELSLISQHQHQHQHQHKPLENPSNSAMAGAAMMSNTNNGSSKSSNYHVCQSCKQQITSRWLFKMFSCSEDTFFHEECLTCSVCNIQLNTTCFFRNEKLYCRFDYNRIFNSGEQRSLISKSCSKCGELIQTNELVMKVEKSHIYHLHCFTCTICCTQLQKGDEFILRGSQLFCRADYEKEQQQLFLYQSQQLSPRGDENNRPRDGRRGPKRPRTILTSTQRRQFKASFEVSPKPCRKVREGLAKETGLSVRVVQVWFQNQRAKMKKIQRKSGNTKGEDGSGSKENKDGKRKRGGDDDSCSSDEDDDEEAGSRSCYDTDSQHGPFTPGGGNCPIIPPRNPNLPYSPDDYNSNDESFICSSEISFEEDSNTGLEPGAEHPQLAGAGGGVIELHNLTSSRPPNSSQDPNAPAMYHHGHHGHPHHGHGHMHHPSSVPLPPQAAASPSYAPGQGQQQQPAINPIDKLYLMQNSYFNNSSNE